MEHVEHELPELLGTAIAPDERRRIELHLDGCPACREVWEHMAVLDRERLVRRDGVPPGYFNQLPARILERRLHGSRSVVWSAIRVAAPPALPAVAGVLFMAVMVWNLPMPSAERSESSVPFAAGEVAEYVASNEIWNSGELIPVAERLLTDRALAGRQDVSEGVQGLEDLGVETTSDLVAGLDDTQMDALINRLSERDAI